MANRAGGIQHFKKDFWKVENLKFARPYFRLEKSARIINRIARGKRVTLLDVGCGPAILARLLDQNIDYYGIDIAIHDPAPNLIEIDFLENPIDFAGKRFDIVVAQGVFEYLGKFQSKKLAEIARLLNDGGTFVVSYTNFGHRGRQIYWAYSNVQPISSFRSDLERFFTVRQVVPSSYNWDHSQPTSKPFRAVNMHLNMDIPLIGPPLAVEYFFVCSPRLVDSSNNSSKKSRSAGQSLVRSFTDGVGAIFDIAGIIQPRVVPTPSFEASLSEDVHNLYVQLGLDPEASNLDRGDTES